MCAAKVLTWLPAVADAGEGRWSAIPEALDDGLTSGRAELYALAQGLPIIGRQGRALVAAAEPCHKAVRCCWCLPGATCSGNTT
jgi:hypothetical protein